MSKALISLKVRIMAASQPLQGIELIDCAKANAKQGIVTASELCGYGNNLDTFKHELQSACHSIGVDISELSDLISHPQEVMRLSTLED